MREAEKKALIALPIVVLIGAAIALAGSQGGSEANGVPVFSLAVIIAFAIQWIAFVPAYMRQTEKFFDITGSLTYISVAIIAALLSSDLDGRSMLLVVLIGVWAARLGTFLFRRIHKAGKDVRFDVLKPSFVRFLNVWTIQGLWVSLTLAAALAAITTSTREDLGVFALVGALIWVVGFAIEVLADAQKSRFRSDPANKGRFMNTGLWARSRHPNYFGEIVLWIGIAVIALPVLSGWQWVTLISPVFVFLLLTRVSGVPMLEKRADKEWGGQDEYEAYKERTPVLVPRLR